MRLRGVYCYARREDGSLAVIAAFVIFMLCLVTGVSVDYSRMAVAKTKLEGALDSATLAAGRDLANGSVSSADVEAKVQSYLAANVAAGGEVPFQVETVSVVIDAAKGALRAESTARLPMTFAGLVGMPTAQIGAKSATSYSLDRVEVALVLDVTGSMDGQKIADLRSAADSLVDSLLPPDGSMAGKVRISIVPFAASVNAGSYANAAKGGWSWNPCVSERDIKPFEDAPPSVALLGDAATDCPSAALVPLNGSPTSLKSFIDGFTASGSTAGHIGLAWGWYTLSPNWSSFWPYGSVPALHTDKNTTKIIVFMTDGDFNTAYSTVHGDSTAQAQSLCDAVKDSKITLYTIGFQVSAAAHAMMTTCATSHGHYFDAENGAELVAVFNAIGKSIRTIWLSS